MRNLRNLSNNLNTKFYLFIVNLNLKNRHGCLEIMYLKLKIQILECLKWFGILHELI